MFNKYLIVSLFILIFAQFILKKIGGGERKNSKEPKFSVIFYRTATSMIMLQT